MKTIQKSKVETIRNQKTKPPTGELVRIQIAHAILVSSSLPTADWWGIFCPF